MAVQLGELYERDYFAWTQDQAAALRRHAETLPNAPIDWSNLIEEVEDFGKQLRNGLRSQLRQILHHLLLIASSDRLEPRAGWMDEVDAARDQIADRITATLRQDLRAELPTLYARARRAAVAKLLRYGEVDAASSMAVYCPWTLEQVLDLEWWPIRA